MRAEVCNDLCQWKDMQGLGGYLCQWKDMQGLGGYDLFGLLQRLKYIYFFEIYKSSIQCVRKFTRSIHGAQYGPRSSCPDLHLIIPYPLHGMCWARSGEPLRVPSLFIVQVVGLLLLELQFSVQVFAYICLPF